MPRGKKVKPAEEIKPLTENLPDPTPPVAPVPAAEDVKDAPPANQVKQRWAKFAKKLHTRALKRNKADEIASAEVISTRLDSLFRDAKLSCVIVALALGLHYWSEGTDPGRKMQLWAYEQLEGSLPAPTEKLPVTVIDFGTGLEATDSVGSTDMVRLAGLVQAVAAYHPAAIGVDVDFGQLQDQSFAENEDKVVTLAEKLTNESKIPVYLTVHRGIWNTPDSWLGDEKYANLVVHPLAPIESLSGQITLIDQLKVANAPGQQTSVPSIAGQLAAAISKSQKSSWLLSKIAQRYRVSDTALASQGPSFPASMGRSYYLNLSALPRIESDAIHVSDAEQLVAYPSVDQKLRNCAVVIGSSAPDGDGSIPDSWTVPDPARSRPGCTCSPWGLTPSR